MRTKLINVLIMMIFFLVLSNARGDTIYKCKSQNGALLYKKTPCQDEDSTVSSWTAKARKQPETALPNNEEDGAKKREPVILSLKQNVGGHYFSDGSINDKVLNFVVDTGASYVALPEAVAHSASIYCDDKITMDTANGLVDSCTAKIKSMTFGPFQIKDVTAVIQPNLNQPLLGMNVLQLFKIEQKNGEMQISVLEEKKKDIDSQNSSN